MLEPRSPSWGPPPHSGDRATRSQKGIPLVELDGGAPCFTGETEGSVSGGRGTAVRPREVGWRSRAAGVEKLHGTKNRISCENPFGHHHHHYIAALNNKDAQMSRLVAQPSDYRIMYAHVLSESPSTSSLFGVSLLGLHVIKKTG